MEPKCVPQLFLGSLPGTCQLVIGYFFPCSLQQSQKSLGELTWASFSLVSNVAMGNYVFELFLVKGH